MLGRSEISGLPERRVGELSAPGGAGSSLNTINSDEGSSSFSVSPIELLFAFLRHRKLIVVFWGVGLIAALIYTANQPAIYQASSRMEVLPEATRVVQEYMSRASYPERTLMTAREWLSSRDVARRVAADLDLANNREFLAQLAGRSRLFSRFSRDDPAAKLMQLSLDDRENLAVGRLQSMISARPVPETNLLELLYRDQSPRLAATIVNQYIRSYILQHQIQSAASTSAARDLIREQVNEVKDKLEKAEEKLINYARDNNLRIDDSNIGLMQGDIAAVTNFLHETEKERIKQQHYIIAINQGDAASLPQIIDSRGAQDLRVRLSELRAQYKANLALMKPAMPEMQQLQARIQETERDFNRMVQVTIDSVKLTFAETLAREKALRARLSELEAQRSRLMNLGVNYAIYKRDANSLRTQYQNLVNKFNELTVTADMRVPVASMVDQAGPMGWQVSPNLRNNLLAGSIASLLFAAMVVYAIEMLSNTFSQPDQIEAALKVPLLGVIPAIDPAELRAFASNSKSPLSEAYRSLRTSLQFAGPDGTPRVLSITSTEPGEGKSTTSWRLAHEFAALGLRVLVIDADMRKPSLHRLFGVTNAAGFSNLLTSDGISEQLGKVVHKTELPNLFVITSGPMPPSPADLLSSARTGVILGFCRDVFDVTIIDCPPVIGLADAPIIGRVSDATMLIVSARNVSRKAATNAVKRLRSTGAVLAGATLNKFSVDRFDYNYEYRYVYYNSYYQYGEKPEAIEDGRHVEQNREKDRAGLAFWADRGRRFVSHFISKHQQVS